MRNFSNKQYFLNILRGNIFKLINTYIYKYKFYVCVANFCKLWTDFCCKRKDVQCPKYISI